MVSPAILAFEWKGELGLDAGLDEGGLSVDVRPNEGGLGLDLGLSSP